MASWQSTLFLSLGVCYCLYLQQQNKKDGSEGIFISRLTRLQPLVIAGSILGLLAFLFDPFATYNSTYDAGRIAPLFLTSLLLIPFPVMAEHYFNLFWLNAPAWSLFREYMANILYGFVLPFGYPHDYTITNH